MCNNVVLPSVCKPICGDGKNMPGEICDDGDVSNSTNCQSDCLGPVSGYLCFGGSTSTPRTC
ncbi:MAG: hypothetical protein IPK55_12585 [Streptococcus sp.]|nr:hypothetical protein [Streptococcus sp.]